MGRTPAWQKAQAPRPAWGAATIWARCTVALGAGARTGTLWTAYVRCAVRAVRTGSGSPGPRFCAPWASCSPALDRRSGGAAVA
eukprot:9439755-Lingulodinium_polyedra.AAC.1